MNTKVHRWLWAALGLAVVLALVWQLAPVTDASNRLAALPANGLGVSSRDLALSEVEQTVFSRARTLKRLYKVGGQMFILQVIDASRDRHAIHDPLYCFRGAGWEVASTRELAVPGGSAQLLSLRRKADSAEAVYWISDGKVRHASAVRYRWQTALRRLTFGNSGAEPVLIILQPFNGAAPSWSGVFERFPALFDL